MIHRFTTLFTLAVATIVASACGSNIATEPLVTSVAGTWALTAVDGKALPYVYSASDPKLEVISKQYVISAAGTFTTSFTLRGTELDGTVNTTTTSDAGTETLADNIVTFVYKSDGSVVTAHVSPTTMTIAGNVTQIFTKQ
ncbi:hypothetical protein BH11GEM1_BH11GEM1_35120 [soil metagenome]